MPRNVEIKARIRDPVKLRRQLHLLPITERFELKQTDTFFNVKSGWLKLRESGDHTGELINYRRKEQATVALSEYLRLACPNPKALQEILTAALGVRGVVKKYRAVFLIDKTRVHLDDVEGLGQFLEIEVALDQTDGLASGERVMAELLKTLHISCDDLVPQAYIDLLEGS